MLFRFFSGLFTSEPVMFHDASVGTLSSSASYSLSIHATFSSSSYALNVHVEYTSIPPGLRFCHISAMISRCNFQQFSTFCVLHSVIVCGSLRNIPSPEQGTSAMIRSKERVVSYNHVGNYWLQVHLYARISVRFQPGSVPFCLSVHLKKETNQ